MNCKEFISLQAEYTDGNLDAARAAEVRAHLSECPTCRRLQAEMEALVHTLHTMDDIVVPETLADDVLARLPVPQKKIVQFPRFLRSWQTYSVAAACILVAVMLYAGTYDKYMMTADEAVPHSYTADIADTAETVPDIESASDNSKIQTPADAVQEPVKSPSAATKGVAQSKPSAPVTATAQPTAENSINAYVPDPNPVISETGPAPTAAPVQNPAEAENAVMPQQVTAEEAVADDLSAAAFSRSYAPASGEIALAAPAALSADVDGATPAFDEAAPESATVTAEEVAPRASGGGSAASRVIYTQQSITYVTDDPAAEAIFEEIKADGSAAVEAAFSAAGIHYTVRQETVDCSTEYNALTEEARSLSDRIAGGETGLAARLSEIETEKQAILDACSVPAVHLSAE